MTLFFLLRVNAVWFERVRLFCDYYFEFCFNMNLSGVIFLLIYIFLCIFNLFFEINKLKNVDALRRNYQQARKL